MTLSRQNINDNLQWARNGDNRAIAEVLRAMSAGDIDAEMALIDLRARSFFYDDFLAAAIEARLSSTAGSGTANAAATTVAGAMNGEITMKTASDNGTHAANGSQLTFDQLNWKASQGGNVFEVRCKLDVVTSPALFIGYTDTISTTVEMPLFVTTTAIDSDATDAAGLIFDTGATVDKWYVGGVSNNTDSDPPTANYVLAPTADTYFTARVELDADGTVRGYIDGGLIGTVAAATRTTIGLTPCIAVGNNTGAQHVLTVDYIAALQNR